eukprot:CAMPEP_0172866356 /NCGR_PEP_ID=MMETSP1075-20121228/81938_1 /TAXON_ID=2916 /ORGANISM="Ceratium fusus, Strain PA161109" /LENGTH=142 /DNA_ID=CAMNT_0013715515 /DNA_START=406 /DNA_END=834 /DNA_ORIENTATION=-
MLEVSAQSFSFISFKLMPFLCGGARVHGTPSPDCGTVFIQKLARPQKLGIQGLTHFDKPWLQTSGVGLIPGQDSRCPITCTCWAFIGTTLFNKPWLQTSKAGVITSHVSQWPIACTCWAILGTEQRKIVCVHALHWLMVHGS